MKLAIFLTFIWLAFAMIMGVSGLLLVPRQMEKDRYFFRYIIKPPVDYIKNFKKYHKRLPSDEEFGKWFTEHNINDRFSGLSYIRSYGNIDANDLYKFKNIDWKNEFAVGVWRGEWEEYYFSWSDKYDGGSYSWRDGIIELVASFFIGVLPLSVLLFIKNWKKRKLLLLQV